jgi:hypothetical protein
VAISILLVKVYTADGALVLIQRVLFNSVDRFHGSTLHGDRCTAGCEAHTNYADESVCLMADNVWNERKLFTLWTA